jgi:glycosyltransferase involved in cell wall biosynthesis
MKVLFIGKTPMDWAWEQWQQKKYPGHLLFGVTQLSKYGIEVDILPHTKYAKLQQISNKIKVLGDLDQQFRILFRQEYYDIVYSGDDLNTSLLTFLRYIGFYKKPIVVIMHRSFRKTLASQIFVKFFLKSKDKLLCLSNSVMTKITDNFDIPKEKLTILPLGMDLSFYNYNPKENQNVKTDKEVNEFILSAGKTHRDYNTLAQAFKKINCNLNIYCSGESAPTIFPLSENINVNYENTKESTILSYEELESEYKKAYAIAIPLEIPPERRESVTLIGNTSLLEAMALGKAIVMTKNPQIDIDIEREGIGFFVEYGDVEGWRKAISYLLDNPQETKEMGHRGRLLCEQKYNLDYFGLRLAEELKNVMNSHCKANV